MKDDLVLLIAEKAISGYLMTYRAEPLLLSPIRFLEFLLGLLLSFSLLLWLTYNFRSHSNLISKLLKVVEIIPATIELIASISYYHCELGVHLKGIGPD